MAEVLTRGATRVVQHDRWAIPVVASLALGLGIAAHFWWALIVRTANPLATAPDPSIETLVDWWPLILVAVGGVWGAVTARYAAGGRFIWLRGAAAGALGNGVFALAIALGPIHEGLAGALPGGPPERFVLLLPLLVALVAAATATSLAIAIGKTFAAFQTALAGAVVAFAPALVIVLGAYAVGLRVGSGDAAMARVSTPALILSALTAGTAVAWRLRRASRRRAREPANCRAFTLPVSSTRR